MCDDAVFQTIHNFARAMYAIKILWEMCAMVWLNNLIIIIIATGAVFIFFVSYLVFNFKVNTNLYVYLTLFQEYLQFVFFYVYRYTRNVIWLKFWR